MPQTLRQLLAKTLDDEMLSKGERLSLKTVLAKLDLTTDQREQVRQIALELAEEAIDKAQPRQVLHWFNEVTKLLQSSPPKDVQEDVAEAWFSPFHDCVKRIEQLFDRAQQQVDICVFTITDNHLTQAILNAHRRGVTVQIISDNDKAFDRGSDIELLQSRGISVRVDITEFHMHHKFALFDQNILLTGSYNWTVGASRDNQENFVITTDRRLVQSYKDEFARLWCRLA